MKNSVADRSNAQPSCAGLFIGGQLGFNDFPGVWIHVDMATPVHSVSIHLHGIHLCVGVSYLYEKADILTQIFSVSDPLLFHFYRLL